MTLSKEKRQARNGRHPMIIKKLPTIQAFNWLLNESFVHIQLMPMMMMGAKNVEDIVKVKRFAFILQLPLKNTLVFALNLKGNIFEKTCGISREFLLVRFCGRFRSIQFFLLSLDEDDEWKSSSSSFESHQRLPLVCVYVVIKPFQWMVVWVLW